MMEWIRWPTMLKGAAGGIGFGFIYAVATGELAAGLLIGLAAGLGFGVGRSYDLR